MRNRALKYTIGFAIIGLIISLLIAYVERNTVNTYHDNMPYVNLGDNVKNRTTKAYLLLEKLLAGDASLDFEHDVMAQLKSSQTILQGAYDGKETELGAFTEPADEETRASLKEALIALDRLIDAARDRWKLRQNTVNDAGDSTTAILDDQAEGQGDQQFDTTYSGFQQTMDKLIDHVTQNVKSDSVYLNLLSWISILLLVVAFTVLCLMLYRMQRSSDALAHEAKLGLEQQERSVSALTGFIEAISSGNYAVDLNIAGDQTNLSTTLISMRDKLRDNADEDRKRNWTTTGLAQIGEILRTPTSTTEELLDNIIKFVVKYTKSNQGGLFILNEETENDLFLELVACYAFERKKYLTKRVTIGEGLVGQCYLEGQRMYLLEVPKEYISITSGLGGANPNALLIVPLKVNEKIYGVLELASFGQYQEYEVDLVEKLAESIASTISAVRVNESTRILLEKTQQQAEEMRAQEEEMRQNMEELEATQEEMRRKEKHIQNMLDGEKKRNEISQKNRKVLMELTKNNDIQSGNWNAALEKLTSTIANQLHVSQCGIWLMNTSRNKLTCDKLYHQKARTFESGTELLAKDFPGYFEAITREDVIAAKDALMHGATKELSDGYLQRQDVRSILNVPFFSEGRLTGIICCEHLHEQKEWTEEDIEFLKSCADLVTVNYNTSKINHMLDEVSDAQETMQTIIDNIPRAVFWKDKELRFQGCNRIFAQVAGLKSTRDLIGRTDFDMPWKEHAEAYRADDQAVMKGRKPRLDHEERNVNSEGQVSWVLTSKVPVMNQHGEIVAVLGMFEDITERKKKDADIEAKLLELDQLKKMLEKKGN
jgi:PAS domain S-box-containing protein